MINQLLKLLRGVSQPCVLFAGHSSRTWYSDETIVGTLIESILEQHPNTIFFTCSCSPFDRLIEDFCALWKVPHDNASQDSFEDVLLLVHAVVALPAEDPPPYPADAPRKTKARKQRAVTTAHPLVIELALAMEKPIFAIGRYGDERRL